MTGTTALDRRLGPVLLTLYGVGTTIGAGIYVLIGEVAREAGPWTAHAFLLASVLAGFTALSFAELAARHPRSAGEALYVREAFGSERLSLVVGLMVAAAGTVSSASIVIGSVGYIQTFVDTPALLIQAIVCLGIGGVAAWGIGQSALAAATITVVEIAGLALVVHAGTGAPGDPAMSLAEIAAPSTPVPALGLLAGAVLAFYAFIGFEDMVNVAEEVKRPRRTIPLAIVATLAIAGALYLLVAAVALSVVPLEELSGSTAPLALVYGAGGGEPRLLAGIAVLATINGVLVQVVMVSRVLFGLSRQGALPPALADALGDVHPATRTPLLATGLVTVTIFLLAAAFPIAELASATSLITLAVFALCNAALVALKRRGPPPEDAPSLPMWLPWTGAVVSLGVLASELGRRLLT